MVIKNDPRKVLELLGTKHREVDPDDEFLDRLAKKTNFYDQPSGPPETLNLPLVTKEELAAELDALTDMKIVEDEVEAPRLLPIAAQQVKDEADAEVKRKAEHAMKEARYASLFDGRSAGSKHMAGVPDNVPFNKLRMDKPQALPQVGATPVSAEQARVEAELQREDEARRAAYMELNRLKEEQTQASDQYKKARERFVATFGHRGAELRE